MLTLANRQHLFVKLINFVMASYLLVSFIIGIKSSMMYDISALTFSEFNINFEGGFVRRGLVGQLLLWLSTGTHTSPVLWIYIICFSCYFGSAAWFFKKFHDKGLNWWLLATCLMFGQTTDIIRKDYMLLCLMIVIVTLMRKVTDDRKTVIISLLLVLGILIHEAFIFYSVPIYALWVWKKAEGRRKRDKAFLYAGILLPVSAFILSCVFHGDEATAYAIQNSWHEAYPELYSLNLSDGMEALTWNAGDTFILHFNLNFNHPPFGPFCVIFQLFTLLWVYYMCGNFAFCFRSGRFSNLTDSVRALSALFIVLVICMLPMFLFLSCDYARLFLYIVSSTFVVYLIFPTREILEFIPCWVVKASETVDRYLYKVIAPVGRKRGDMTCVFLMLIGGLSRASCNPYGSFANSVIGKFIVVFLMLIGVIGIWHPPFT